MPKAQRNSSVNPTGLNVTATNLCKKMPRSLLEGRMHAINRTRHDTTPTGRRHIHSSTARNTTMMTMRVALVALLLVVAIAVFMYLNESSEFVRNRVKSMGIHGTGTSIDGSGIVPAALLGLAYNESDFVNEQGIAPAYWDCQNGKCNSSEVWGPCYPSHKSVDWEGQVELYSTQPPFYQKKQPISRHQNDLAGSCRPGFLIIGAGKCGTSSLYQYLTQHPRVLPASKKQIHYFKYYAMYPLRWYLRHFPSTESFLASGALMTGEASPGYIPYPEVANMVARRLPGPRIIAAGREPLDRAYSSYRYNYVNPTMDLLRKGRISGINGSLPDEEYEQYLFSFEDMMKAELVALRECFAPNSTAILEARHKWEKEPWARDEYDRRDREGLPSLIDLDGFCYGQRLNRTVLRRQWAGIMAKHPEKIIDKNNLHLKQSFIGRGLYALPLEWWYIHFPKEEIFFMCTEELSDLSGAPMNNLGNFLGLPSFNFSEVVQGGAYNVGGHKGYDKETSWVEIEEETNVTVATTTQQDIPLSDDFLRELKAFILPYNERLFALTGRRCDW